MRRLIFSLALAALLGPAAAEPQDTRTRQPDTGDTTRFAVLGDAGTGGDKQLEIAQQLVKSHQRLPIEFTIMLGDNLYGRERPRDYEKEVRTAV